MLNLRVASVAVVAALAVNSAAAAATVSYTFDRAIDGSIFGTGRYDELYFPAFDTRLGQLTAFEISVETQYEYGAYWDQSTMIQGSYYWNAVYEGWQLAVQLEEINDGELVLLSDWPYKDAGHNASTYPGEVGSYTTGLVQHTVTQKVTDPSQLEKLSIGDLRIAGFDLPGLEIYEECLSVTCGSLTLFGHADHHLTFTYVYNPVPEPTTWALLILGFGAAGTALRRRQAIA